MTYFIDIDMQLSYMMTMTHVGLDIDCHICHFLLIH